MAPTATTRSTKDEKLVSISFVFSFSSLSLSFILFVIYITFFGWLGDRVDASVKYEKAAIAVSQHDTQFDRALIGNQSRDNMFTTQPTQKSSGLNQRRREKLKKKKKPKRDEMVVIKLKTSNYNTVA